jgi:hypothetical protein
VAAQLFWRCQIWMTRRCSDLGLLDWPGRLRGAFVLEAIESVFCDDGVTGADRDRLTSARIAAITRRNVGGRPLTGAEEAAALAELAEVADGRIDLLGQEAGLAIGFHDQDADAPVYLQIAQLCIKAGADTAVISRWIEEGRRRAAAARRRPFTG